MRNTIFLLLFVLFSFEKINAQQQASASTIFSQMKKVADWQWKSLETEGWKNPKKDWTSGVLYTGMMAWSKLADSDIYYKKLIGVGENNKWKTGKYRFFADDYCVGQTYAQLYSIYKKPEFIEDLKNLGDSLVKLPHTESLEWKNNIHTREWAWCDALFMGPPTLGYLSEATGDLKYINKASELWWKSTAYLFDGEEHLFYRDSRYFNKKEKNGAKVFWSRGNGWVIAGLARVLSVLPQNHPDRKRFVDLFVKMSGRLAQLQQPDGTWHASLLDPESYPSKETSGTGLICYAMAWGINNGLLPYEKYKCVISNAWTALSSSVHPDGKLGFVQPQGAAPDKVGYDDTDVFGVGAFLLAGSEMFPLYLKHRNNVLIKEVYNGDSVAKAQIVELKWLDIAKKISKAKPNKIEVRDGATGILIPSIVVCKGKKPQLLRYKAELSAGTNRFFEISTK
ncbi:glycoside hydrolase family 88 protein [Pedobacter nutrimenti]|uniref:glycoside hydrolase family 88/105 protein n=1 Tax=Pedobacter nutrimenti TaxID=1241337 RepID=UPI00292F7E04|nr:glycoside hydrolase family 88 protein [Pedobacter nutrimenti]